MILLLSLYKKKREYYMDLVDTEQNPVHVHSQLVNLHLLKECHNIHVHNYKHSRQNPLEYIKSNFDVSKLIIKEEEKNDRERDFQIISIYYDDNTPCLYRSIDRTGKISIHDISELEYARNSLYGQDIRSLPLWVEHKPIKCAYQYLKELESVKLEELPCRLFKQYLQKVRGFEESFNTVTEINNGTLLEIHEQMLNFGSAMIKLVECIPKDKKTYLTKQDALVSPYPKERTVDFLTTTITLVASHHLLTSNHAKENDIKFGPFNKKAFVMTFPLSFQGLDLLETFNKGKTMYRGFHLNSKGQIPKEIYAYLLPNELFKMPNHFYHEMKNKPFNTNAQLKRESEWINQWMYAIALYYSWQYYTFPFKQKMRNVFKVLPEVIQDALTNLVYHLGPKDALYIMKWTKKHIMEVLESIVSLDSQKEKVLIEEDLLFTFYQNDFDLPECLRVYSEETVNQYGGEEKLKEDYMNSTHTKQMSIINALESIEKEVKNKKTDEKVKGYYFKV